MISMTNYMANGRIQRSLYTRISGQIPFLKTYKIDRDDDIERIVIICDKRGTELTQLMEDGLNLRKKNLIVEVDINPART